MKTLIVYYSFTESNEVLALQLQKRIGCEILKIEELKLRTAFTIMLDLLLKRNPAIKTRSCSVIDYDHLILIAPIWGAKVASPLKSFILREQKNIKRYSFLSFCGGVAGQKEKIEKQLTNLSGKKPVKVTELWISDLPMTKEKRASIKWNKGYRMNRDDMKYFESNIDAFLELSGVAEAENLNTIHEYGD